MNELTKHTLNDVTIKKADLLQILKENLESHNEVINASTQAYYEALREELALKLSKVQKGVKLLKEKLENLTSCNPEEGLGDLYYVGHFKATKPVSYEASYQAAIRKVELSIHDEFTLDNKDFERYVLNNWEWKDEFVKNASFYSTGNLQVSGAMAKFSGVKG